MTTVGGGAVEPPLHVGFVMEQHLGHRTYAENLRRAVAGVADVRATWVGVDYEPGGAWWERIPAESVRAALRGRTEVGRGLRGVDPDVCVFNTQVPAVLASGAARRRPYVLCTDVTPAQYDAMAAGYDHQADRPGPVGWLKHRWNRRVFRRAAAHAPWSSWVRDSLVSDYGVDPTRIEVIPPGVDTTRWPTADHVEGGPMRVLFVGGDFVRKGGDHLLRAFAGLPAGAAELHVVTRSDVPREHGVVVHHGLSPNDPALTHLFRSSDVFVLPSRAETFGIAAVEAAATGLPLVVSDIGGLSDLVVDGATGFSVTPGSSEELAAALRTLLDDPALRRRMGHAARSRAEREFDAARNGERLLDLARAAAGRRVATPASGGAQPATDPVER